MISICNILAYCTQNTPITIKTNNRVISVEFEDFNRDGIKLPVTLQIGKDTCYLQVGNKHQFISDLNLLESIYLEEVYKNNKRISTTKKKKELSALLEPYIQYYLMTDSVITVRFYSGDRIVVKNKSKKLKLIIESLNDSYKLTLINDLLGQYIHLNKGYKLSKDLKQFLNTFH